MLLLRSRVPSSTLPVIVRARCRYSSTYRASEFTSNGPYSNRVESKEAVIGPLGSGGGVKITPRVLKQHLDRYVVGQDRSKRILSTAIYHHYQRVHQARRREEREMFAAQQPSDPFEVDEQSRADVLPGARKEFVEEPALTIEKSNVLCLGPTGVGKTLMVRTLAKVLDVPFSMSDCTPFTMAGYVGEDVDQAVHRLLIAANHDVRRAETGIICLDEFDKIAKPKSMHGGAKDISGEGVQQALLKIIEGTTLQIHTKPERRPPMGLPNSPGPGSFNQPTAGGGGQKGEVVTIDTSDILFIFTGAFIGLDKIISDRVAKGSIGFNAHVHGSHSSSHPQKNPLELTEPGDLITFGMIPEIVGRIPVTTAVESLSQEMLVRVLTEPRNALLRQYETLFALSGVELRFTSPALREVARSALAMGTGARGLRTVVERLLSDAMFEAPGTSIKHVLVNEAAASRKQLPLYFARGQRHKFEAAFAAEEETWVARGNRQIVGAPADTVEEAVRAAGSGA
ncbi:P-loop containing nucleoside triphosphate hydrolase protein [Sphaerosporella brunnea]|uniref:P-loop containing nucleoside triphosphate hydrolase protein n=1 Tax=Sphaerosporella brunnea TaxID=1250544 RepID=A0A5J5F477_9PEZI|nr:P-loop containing nucleoside triphosphate hydrolase protein [Sphaerosporella brunnea]